MIKLQTPNPKIFNWSSVIGLLLLAFALRLYRLDFQSIWVDEGISLHLALSSPAEIVADRAANIHPPLYFFLLKGWVTLAGASIFSARFLSALASFLQVTAVYAVARRWLGRPAARIAALLTALSPLSVIYAQEMRAYAFLPLIYLALLAAAKALTRLPAPRPRAVWLFLGITEAIGLYLHYTAFFLVAYVACWMLWTFWKERRRADLRRWLVTQLLVGLTYLPWLVAVLLNWSSVQAEAETGTALTQPPTVGYVAAQVWGFYLTGLLGAASDPAIRLLATGASLGLVALTLLRLAQPAARRPVARLLAHWLIPFTPALVAWAVRPFSHPRYTILYAPGLTLLAAAVICPPNVKRRPATSVVVALTAFSLALTSLAGLRAYFFDPAFAKDDWRSVARYLEETTGPEDLILVPDGDWTLSFVYQGAAPIRMPGVSDEEKMWTNLARWTARRRRVSVVSYHQGIGGDQRDVAPFALEMAGMLVERENFENILVRSYWLDDPLAPLAWSAGSASFGPLALIGNWIENEVPSDTALTLALRWRLEQPTDQRCGLTIRLLDIDGWPLTARDALLLDGQLHPTDRWSAGQETTTYHILPISPDTPPLTYTLALGLYEQTEGELHPLDLLDEQGTPQGQWLSLGDVRLTDPVGLADNPYKKTDGPPSLPQPVELADGLQLLGAGLDRSTLSPGHSLFVTLRWQATRAPLPDLRPRLALVQAGQELGAVESAPALGRYPTDQWRAGETIVEHRRLVIPPAADGLADVALSVGSRRLVLGQVEIKADAHTFTPPPISHPLDVHFAQVARLIGYDLPPQTFTAGEPITLTLYWQALDRAADVDYTVFTHILAADGHLVGQHDSPPVAGARPTLGWVTGEIIMDQHTMTFNEPYAGPARVEVGLYDPATLERVAVEESENFVLLPTPLTIQAR
jgi:mannosyltransferase